jgi:hypothetical protein
MTSGSPAGAVPVADDALQTLARLREVGRVARQPAQGGVAVGGDPGERLVNLVRDGGRHFSHRHDPRDMSQLSLHLPQGLFCLLTLCDVHHRSNKLDAARFISYGMSHDVDIFEGTIRHQQATFMVKIFAILRRALDYLFHQGRVFRMNPLESKLHGWLRRSVVSEDSKRFL